MEKYGAAAPSTAEVALQLSGSKNAITEITRVLPRQVRGPTVGRRLENVQRLLTDGRARVAAQREWLVLGR